MRAVLLLLVAVCLAVADVNVNQYISFTDSRCDGGNWDRVDRTSDYVSGFTGVAKICVRSYMTVCSGPTGVEPCNEAYGTCKDVEYDWQDKDLYPQVKTVVKPKVCVSNGAVMSADTKIVAIAQVILAFFIYLASFGAVAAVAMKIKGGALAIVSVGLQLLMAILLTFSYFYLNGLIQLAASLAALALFIPRNHISTGLGILILLSAFFWSTYSYGLGYMQTNARFTANTSEYNYFENMCNSYYRGYFTFVQSLNKINDNAALGPWGYCMRGWVSATTFFQMFSQLLLVLQTAAGVKALLFQEEEPKATSETEPAQ